MVAPLMRLRARQTETPKRYRYTGKERDEETGFTYHGARYYAAWFGRWTSCDPAGMRDATNLYLYPPNPVRFIDPGGTEWVESAPGGPGQERSGPVNSQRTPTSLRPLFMATSSLRWDRPGKHSCISYLGHLTRSLMIPSRSRNGNEGRNGPKPLSSHRKLPAVASCGHQGAGWAPSLPPLADHV